MRKADEKLRESILIVENVPTYFGLATDALSHTEYATETLLMDTQAPEKIRLRSPDLIILNLIPPDPAALEFCSSWKADRFTGHIPIVILVGPGAEPDRFLWLERGADAVLDYRIHASELLARIDALMRRHVDRDPVTTLPSGGHFRRELDARLAKNLPTGVLYADIDHFEAYNLAYSREAGDRVLRLLAKLMVDGLPQGDTVAAYLGDDDFMAFFPPEVAETYAQTLLERFKAARPEFYGDEDLARGYLQANELSGEPERSPLMTLSAALMTNKEQVMINFVRVSSALAKVMLFVKLEGGDRWERGEAGNGEP